VLFDIGNGGGNYIGEQALLAFPRVRRQRYKHDVFLRHDGTVAPVKERVHLYVHPSSPPELLHEPVDEATVLLAFDVLPGDAVVIGLSDMLQYF